MKSIPSVADVQQTCYKRLYDNLYSGLGYYINEYWPSINDYRSKLAMFGLPENFLPATAEETSHLLISNLGAELCRIYMIHNEGNEGKNPQSTALAENVKNIAQEVVTKRLKELGKTDAEITVILRVLLAAYDHYVGNSLNSVLTDTNQLTDAAMKSVTDDLNVVLKFGK